MRVGALRIGAGPSSTAPCAKQTLCDPLRVGPVTTLDGERGQHAGERHPILEIFDRWQTETPTQREVVKRRASRTSYVDHLVMQRTYAPANYALAYPDQRGSGADLSASGPWPQWEQSQGASGSGSSASWLVSPSNVFTHPRSAPHFDPLALSLSPPPTPGATAQSPSQELEHLRQRARELEIINQFATSRVEELEKERAMRQKHPEVATFVPSPEFLAEWEARTEARKRQYCSPNRAGNALCAWHDSRRERRAFPARMAPPNHLNCGCTFNEALFEQALAAHGVGSYYPGESVRMDPALRTPLLKLLEWRYNYKDGDFDRDPVTGQWVQPPRDEKRE
ncbi:hypothetical protein FS749_014339 [Ceratobasidium sp. UAMH 11750]|nr:hypothetical protein FS749_014339 [Ceratobasidium sp. UAMH 11750]